MSYSDSSVVSGSVTDVRSGWHVVLYYWVIPNRNTKDGISFHISWVGGLGVLRTKGLECGSNGRIILGAVFVDEAFCAGLLGCTAYGWVGPTAV